MFLYSLTECGLVLHFSIHEFVFMLADVDRGYNVRHSCSFFIFCSSFAPLFAKLDFAVFPDAFPCIIYEKKKKIKKKKKNIWLIFHCS